MVVVVVFVITIVVAVAVLVDVTASVRYWHNYSYTVHIKVIIIQKAVRSFLSLTKLGKTSILKFSYFSLINAYFEMIKIRTF